MPILLVFYLNQLNECSELIGVFDCSKEGKKKMSQAEISYCSLYHNESPSEHNIIRVHGYLNNPSHPLTGLNV